MRHSVAQPVKTLNTATEVQSTLNSCCCNLCTVMSSVQFSLFRKLTKKAHEDKQNKTNKQKNYKSLAFISTLIDRFPC